MKVLAIRGRNLASLAGEFELDFIAEPLAGAGLFAISGPTGAGKSTLLDTLCLALYDDTPRLQHAGAKGVYLPDVGAETLSPRDPRNLLRRGCGEGFAEVDFVGNDGAAYRARWSVRRARNRTTGKLQATEMSLLRLPDEQPIATQKSETKQAIEARLGLNFAQFTRAVLLAQNEFSAFLRADDNERAALLETLTGSDRFSLISQRAYQRHKAEHEALERLRAKLGDLQPLDEEARTALEQARREADARLAALRSEIAQTEAHLRWFSELEKLTREESEATAARDRAAQAVAAAAPARAQFARVEAVQPARPLLAERERCTRERNQAETTLADARKALEQASEAHTRADTARQRAQQTLDAAEQAGSDAAPALQQARNLDHLIAELAPAHDKAQQAVAQEAQAEQAARDDRAKLEAELTASRDRLSATDRWLDDHRPLAALAEGWGRWDTLLQGAAEDAAACAELERGIADADATIAGRRERAETAEQTLAAATADLEARTRTAEAARQAAGRHDPDALAKRRRRNEQRRDALLQGERRWGALHERESACTRLHRQSDEQAARVAELDDRLARVRQELPGARAARDQAARSLDLARLASSESVEQLRAGLEPDTPCPVCGAHEHPYREEAPPLRAALTALEQDFRAHEETIAALSREEAGLAAQRDDADGRLSLARTELAEAEQARDQAAAAWAADPLAAEAEAIDAENRAAWFTERLIAAAADLENVAAEEQALRQALRERDAAERAREQARKAHDAAQGERQAAHEALREATAGREAQQRQRDGKQRELEQTLADLDGAFTGDWRSAWAADPDAFRAARRQEVDDWQRHSAEQERLQGAAERTGHAIDTAATTLADRAQRLAAARDQFDDLDRRMNELRTERAGLFDGHPADQEEQRLTAAVETARRERERADASARAAAEEQARRHQALRGAEADLTARTRHADQAAAKLGEWLSAFNARPETATALDEPALTALLAHDATWIADERRAQKTLDDALTGRNAALEQCSKLRAGHEAARPTEASADDLRATLDEQHARVKQADADKADLDARLRDDDRRRQASAETMQAIDAQEATTRVWAQLNELIGSADGKKFRNFAQQVTLDLLLGYANRHLDDLSRRYRLQRVNDTLALQVIDRDMGDEIRSVHSLSGGESFLVSLALALALASLSSHRVKVESLFIDEGFGSLDAETLRVAMDALDRLQSQGRKVGVISHVQEMAERIAVRVEVKGDGRGRSGVWVGG